MDGLVGKNRLKDIWKRIFSAMKMITGDVDFENDGTLQEQISTSNKKLDEKLGKTEDSKDLTTTFTSNDSTNVTAWTDVGLLTSGEKHSSMLQKVSTMFKNIRYLYHMLGTADISALGEGADIGTVTGAISKLNSDFINGIGGLAVIYKSFNDIPINYGIRCYCVAGSGSNSSSPYNDEYGWWNVIQFGIGNRLTQITSQVFIGYIGQNELWIRNKHDNNWSDWVKLSN